ncbi:hypothetical protein [Nannocystis pusilla]|uniref:hypothetical protein n=1 Tax=Nannocystis pusilla TaxID=889268 RepID=UPI003DA22567
MCAVSCAATSAVTPTQLSGNDSDTWSRLAPSQATLAMPHTPLPWPAFCDVPPITAIVYGR